MENGNRSVSKELKSTMNKTCCLSSLLIIALLIPFTSQADIYKFVDRNGYVYYSDKAKTSKYKLIIRSKRKSSSFKRFRANRKKFFPFIETAAKKHNIDPDLLDAVIRVESAYNPDAVSKKGAVGLMQLMPATADRYGVKNRNNPAENINGGADYLSDLLKLFKSDIKLALAAYNAGEQAVKKYGNQIPPYRETQNYVAKVMNYYRR